MKNKEKKVIILDNLSSPFVAQAIIILKENIPDADDKIIKEAERIVSGFFPQKKKPRPAKAYAFAAVGASIFSFVLLALLLFRL